jgi:2-polyprenyl-3-methyl-5-hydroxy-6-metoxy-1,4-benzoquinol methylase
MTTQETKKQVVDRFNREGASVWNQVHSGEIADIIQWEVKKRKEFAREFIREHFQDKPAAILEIGCGAGRNLEEILSQHPAWRGTGVDNASAMIEHCRKQYAANPQMSFEMLDIDSAALARQFDVILLLGVVGYLDSNRAAFRNIQRMLRPGGYVLFTYGKRFGVARTVRAGARFCVDKLRAVLNGLRGKPSGAQSSFFRCYTLSEVKRALPPGLRLVSHVNLVFGSGILKRSSVALSRFLERIFTRRDPFRLALTSLVIAVNEPKSNLGK